MKISEIMTKAAVSDSADDTVAEAARRMHEQQTGSLLVMDGERLVGIITERDVLKVVGRGVDPQSMPIKDAMTTEVITIEPDTRLREAAKLMATQWIRHLPVVADGKVVGIVTRYDLLHQLAGIR